MDTPEAIEKTVLTFTVKDVCDLNGNVMESPVTWTAYIDRNQLRWSERSVDMEKELDEPLTFTVDIENQGGTVKNFTIEGCPSWLEVSSERGSIDPQGLRTVTFTVDEGLNVGTFDEVLYVRGDNNVSEALPLTLKVNGKLPDWAVEAGDYKYNMNLFGRMRIDGVFSADADDRLAVFDATGRCIGVAANSYLKSQDMWYTFLTVYSNEKHVDADRLEFRAWDASTGTIYAAIPARPIAFDCDKVYGTASSPVVFDAKDCMIRNIGLVEGWNWISFNVSSPLFDTPSAILAKAGFAGGEVVKDETEGLYMAYDGQRDRWVSNNPDRPFAFDNRHSFLLQSPSAQTLSLAGSVVSGSESLTLTIRPGWNYIAYLPLVNLPVREALAGFEASEGDIVKSQDQFAMYNDGAGWIGSLTYMEPGKGYMLHSSKAATLTYPDLYPNGAPRTLLRTNSLTTLADEPARTSAPYETNMSVVAVVADNMPVVEGDRLVAFADGERRGATAVSENSLVGSHLFFLSVDGLGGEDISFALERSGEVIAETSPLMSYRPNAVHGDVIAPTIIDFSGDLAVSVYPNPFDDRLNFAVDARRNDAIEIYVNSITGALIHRHAATAAADGRFEYRLDNLSGMPVGFYTATVVVNGNKHVYKLIKR